MTFHYVKILHLISTYALLAFSSAYIWQTKRSKSFMLTFIAFALASFVSGSVHAYRWRFHLGEVPLWVMLKVVLWFLYVVFIPIMAHKLEKRIITQLTAMILIVLMVLASVLKPL